MSTAGSTPGSQSGFHANWRHGAGILLAGGLLITVVQVAVTFDAGHRNLATISAALLTAYGFALWLIRGLPLPRAVRWTLMAVLLLPFILFRLEGFVGDMWPRIVWRWEARPHASLSLPDLPPAEGTPPTADLNTTSPHDYPRFLGADLSSHVRGVRLARDWQAQPPREVWRQRVGAGWSSFAVVGEFALTQEERSDLESTLCYRWRTGDLVWSASHPGRHYTTMGGAGPRATPTIAAGRVFVLGAEGMFECLDGATGKVLWSHNILQAHGTAVPDWGKSASPLVVDDRVIVSIGGVGRSVAAYHVEDGRQLWLAGDGETSYASPVLASYGGVPQIVMLNAGGVVGHELETGRVLWSHDWPGIPPKVPNPIPLDDQRLLISSGYGMGCKLLAIVREGDDWRVTTRWNTTQLRPKFMNPIVVDEHLYGIDDGTAITCLDLSTGRRLWKAGRYGHGQLLHVGGLFIVQAESGDVALVTATPQGFEELGRFRALNDRTWNNPVLVGSHLLVRNDQEAACFELPLASD